MVFCKAPVISPSRTEAIKSNSVMPIPTASAESSERDLLRPKLRNASLNACVIRLSFPNLTGLFLYVMQRLRWFAPRGEHGWDESGEGSDHKHDDSAHG